MTQIPDVLLPKLAAGVHAGALEAIRRARSTGTKLVIWRDGQIVEITADEADAMLKIEEGKATS
jgi:hypothetical protein